MRPETSRIDRRQPLTCCSTGVSATVRRWFTTRVNKQQVAQSVEVDNQITGHILARSATAGRSSALRDGTPSVPDEGGAAASVPPEVLIASKDSIRFRVCRSGFETDNLLAGDGVMEWARGEGSARAEPTTNSSS